MKKILPLSKIPNDIKYRLGLVETRLEDTMVLLSSLDPVAFPGGELDSLIVAFLDAKDALLAVQAVRPRKKTEEVEVAPDAPEVAVEVTPESAPDAPVDGVLYTV
jgi:hypothetical protein